MVLPPSSWRQAAVHRTVAFYFRILTSAQNKTADTERYQLFCGSIELNVYLGLGLNDSKNQRILELQHFFGSLGLQNMAFLRLNLMHIRAYMGEPFLSCPQLLVIAR